MTAPAVQVPNGDESAHGWGVVGPRAALMGRLTGDEVGEEVLYAGAVVVSLLRDEFFPDPANIAHGMVMAHAFIPMIVWTIIGILDRCLIWGLLVVVKGVGSKKKQQMIFSLYFITI